MLEAVHLVKRFSGVTVVNDVSFELRPGEVVGYLGPNGSGKTTTTRMLTGLLEPTSGRVLVNGRRIDEDLPAFHRRLGYVPEEPHLYPFLSGREYLELVGRLRELPPALLAREDRGDARTVRTASRRRPEHPVVLEGHEAAAPDHRRAPSRPRRAHLRRTRFGPRRDDDAGVAPSGTGAREAGQGDPVQLARARHRGEAVRTRHRAAPRERRRRRFRRAAAVAAGEQVARRRVRPTGAAGRIPNGPRTTSPRWWRAVRERALVAHFLRRFLDNDLDFTAGRSTSGSRGDRRRAYQRPARS